MADSMEVKQVIEAAIIKAITHPDAREPNSHDYPAWIEFFIMNELRLAGLKIVKTD
ncbi:MAG TPA: hypothetical protein VIJ62_01735 [Rhizomicrobium sp.]